MKRLAVVNLCGGSISVLRLIQESSYSTDEGSESGGGSDDEGGQRRSKKCDDYRLSILFIFCAQIYHPEVKFESKRQATMVYWIRYCRPPFGCVFD
jgi:hypothetical protein